MRRTRVPRLWSGVCLAAGILLLGTPALAASGPQSSTLAHSTLNTKIWTSVIGQDTQLSMTNNPGWMTIGTEYAPNASFATTLHNMVLQPVSASANWTVSVETSFFGKKFGPAGTLPNFVQGGIYAWAGTGSWVRVLRQPPNCTLELNWLSGGTLTQPPVPTTASAVVCNNSDDPLWLRMTKNGDVYTGYYSTDGKNWVETNSQAMPGFSPTAIGLNANQGGGKNPPTEFGFRDFTVAGSASAAAPASAQPTTSASSGSLPQTGSGPLPLAVGMLLLAAGSLGLTRGRLKRLPETQHRPR